MDLEILVTSIYTFQQILITYAHWCSDCCNFRPSDCLDYKDMGYTESGVYRIYPPYMYKGYEVYCDMTTDDGGWIVFQRREDGSVDFNRTWKDYSLGFGNVSHEHWLGFVPLMRIMFQGYFELRIDLTDWQDETRYALYRIFSIDQNNSFRLTIMDYTGTAGDALDYHNGMKFTTYDNDNDNYDEYNCAQERKGPWWHKTCQYSNLNGIYFTDGGEHKDGVVWRKWHGDSKKNYTTMKSAEMKLRRT